MARGFSTRPTFLPTSQAQNQVSISPSALGFALPVLWTMTAFALTFAVQTNWGFYRDSALMWLTGGGILLTLSVLTDFSRLTGGRGSRCLFGVLGMALVWQFFTLCSQPLATFAAPVPENLRSVISMCLVVAAAVIFSDFLPLLPHSYGLERARFLIVLALFAVLCVLIIRVTPSPSIDVLDLQKASCKALLSSVNPYGITLPDKYHGELNYGPDIQKNGLLLFGYCYPPLTLLLTLPSYLFFGDPRFSQVIALFLSGLLLGFARPGRLSFMATTLFLFTPRLFFVVEHAWTEPFVILAFAATIFCASRKPQWTIFALSLFLASKQFIIFTLPAFGMLPKFGNIPSDKLNTKNYFGPPLLALLTALPFVLWDMRAFYHSVFWIYTKFPPSNVSLSYNTWFNRHGWAVPEFLSFLCPALSGLWLLGIWTHHMKKWHQEWQSVAPSFFSASVALILFFFFAFSKRSFCNHYFLVIAALWGAVAAWPLEESTKSATADSGSN